MWNTRRIAVGLWATLAGLTTVAGSASAAPGSGGLFSASACISPAVLLVLTLTPAETLVTTGVKLIQKRFGIELDGGN